MHVHLHGSLHLPFTLYTDKLYTFLVILFQCFRMTYNIFFIYYVFQVCCLVYISIYIYIYLNVLIDCVCKMKLQGQGQRSTVNTSINLYQFVFIQCRHIHCCHDSSLLWATTREIVHMDVLSCCGSYCTCHSRYIQISCIPYW